MGDLGDADGLWNNCAASIRAQVSDAVWRTTFSGAKAVAFDEGELVLVVPNGLQKERIEGRYLGLVQDAIDETAAHEVSVRVEIDTDWSTDDTPEIELPNADLGLTAPATTNPAPAGRDEKFTFDHVGGNKITLKGAHGKYLVAESNGDLNANRDRAHGWEKFELHENNFNGDCANGVVEPAEELGVRRPKWSNVWLGVPCAPSGAASSGEEAAGKAALAALLAGPHAQVAVEADGGADAADGDGGGGGGAEAAAPDGDGKKKKSKNMMGAAKAYIKADRAATAAILKREKTLRDRRAILCAPGVRLRDHTARWTEPRAGFGTVEVWE